MKDENMDWEREAPVLAGLPKTTPYRVPDYYFEDLTSQIQRTVFLNSLKHKENQGFTVPANYFEELNQQIKSSIAAEKIRSLAQTDGFSTPHNYFEQLQANVLEQTTTTKKNNIIRLWHHEAMKYVAAACFIVLSASGLYLNQQHNIKQLQHAELANEALLYDIDENVIIEHLLESQNTNATFASDSEMENYILDHYSSRELYNNL